MDSANTQPIGPLDDDELLALVPSVGAFKLLGPCLLFQRVGEGGFGKVYRGRHLTFTYPFDCAVKCLFGERDVERFQQEATLGASLSHENLVRVYDAGSFAHLHYLVMEWVEGETVLDRARRRGGSLPFDEVAEIARQAARGLAHLHSKGLVHRDLKPANVMVGFDGLVKVADLGIAKSAAAGAPGPTLTGQVFGTPRYMPPEQFEDTSRVGPSSDIYSLGATLYRLLVGRDGVEGTSARDIERVLENNGHARIADAGLELPSDFVALLDRCTRNRAEDRPRDGQELLEALERMGGTRANLGADEALVTLRADGPAFGPTKEDVLAARRARPQTTRPAVASATSASSAPTATAADGTVPAQDTGVHQLPPGQARSSAAPTGGATSPRRGRNLALAVAGLAAATAVFVLVWPREPEPEPARAERNSGVAVPAALGGGTNAEPTNSTEDVAQPPPPTDPETNRDSSVAVLPTSDATAAASPQPPAPALPELPAIPDGPDLPGFRREALPDLGAPGSVRDVACYLPEWGPEVPAALLELRFVLPERESDYLIQLTEFSGAQFAALDLDPSLLPHRVPPAAGNLPQGDLSLDVAERIAARLNDLRPAGSPWRFAVPTVEQWQAAARASSERPDALHPFAAGDPEPRGVFRTVTRKASSAPEAGQAPGPEEMETRNGTLAPVLSSPQGRLALCHLVGNVGELCVSVGGEFEAALMGGSFQYAEAHSTVQHVRPRSRLESNRDQGLRLCVQLDGR